MTERELWKALADDCVERLVDRYYEYAYHPGLCTRAFRLAECADDALDLIYDKIQLERDRLNQHRAYIWPNNDIQSRIDFCNRMIKELDDEAAREEMRRLR